MRKLFFFLNPELVFSARFPKDESNRCFSFFYGGKKKQICHLAVAVHILQKRGKKSRFKEGEKKRESYRAVRDHHANLSCQHSVALCSERALQTQWQPRLYQLFICFSSSWVAHIMLQKTLTLS